MKTVIFDFDGTLVDSMIYWERTITDYLKVSGVVADEGLMSIIKPMGITIASAYIIERYGLEVEIPQIVNSLSAGMGEKYKNTIPLKPFAKEFIERLKALGINICVATAIERRFVTVALKRTGLMQYIDYLVTISDVGVSKSSAKIFLNCAKYFRNQPQECMIFEDSLMSCQIAKKTGFNVIGVRDYTNFDEATLMKEVCDGFINSFSDIL